MPRGLSGSGCRFSRRLIWRHSLGFVWRSSAAMAFDASSVTTGLPPRPGLGQSSQASYRHAGALGMAYFRLDGTDSPQSLIVSLEFSGK